MKIKDFINKEREALPKCTTTDRKATKAEFEAFLKEWETLPELPDKEFVEGKWRFEQNGKKGHLEIQKTDKWILTATVFSSVSVGLGELAETGHAALMEPPSPKLVRSLATAASAGLMEGKQ